MHIELGYGAKWKLVYQFTQSGPFKEHYIHRYTQVNSASFTSLAALQSNSTVTSCTLFCPAVLLHSECMLC